SAQVLIATGPIAVGATVSATVSGLPSSTTVYFVVWARDAGWNYSAASSSATVYTAGGGGGGQSLRGPQASAAFKLGDVFAFPNPAKRKKPTLHIEVGIADSVDVRIYDVAGVLRSQARIEGIPPLVDRGTGLKYAYEYPWDTSGVGSDVYI